jgi:hypothetical protein
MLAVAGLAMLTSGCATYAWFRPDTPPELAVQDEAECAQLARDAAYDIVFGTFPRMYAGPWRPWPHPGWWGWGDPYWWGPGDPLWRMDVEQRIHDRCMRNRGYELHRVPED